MLTHPVIHRPVTLAVAVAVAAGLAGCSAGAPDPVDGDTPLHVAFANLSSAQPAFSPINDAMVAAGEELGWTIDVYDNQFDPAVTLDVARTMAATGPDVIIDWSIDPGIAASLGETFSDAGIPCIAMNAEIPGCAYFNISNDLYGLDNGTNMAAAATERGWDPESTTFIGVSNAAGGEVLHGQISNAFVTYSEGVGLPAVNAADITLSTTTYGDHYVQIDSGGTLAGASDALRVALQNVDVGRKLAITTVNDDAATGAVAALEAAGFLKEDVILSSGGGGAQGFAELRDDDRWVSVAVIYLQFWAGYTLAMADALEAGQTLPDLTVAPQNNLTKETVDDYVDADGNVIKAPPVPEGSRYLLDTGVLQQLGLAG